MMFRSCLTATAGMALLASLVFAAPASAAPEQREGCNGLICVEVIGDANHWEVFGATYFYWGGSPTIVGSIGVQGPGLTAGTPMQVWANNQAGPHYTGSGSGQLCASFTEPQKPSGLACLDV